MKKRNLKMLVLIVLISIISFSISYFGKGLYIYTKTNSTTKTEQSALNSEITDTNTLNSNISNGNNSELDIEKEKNNIEKLSKVFILSSTNFDKETLLNISTGEYKNKLYSEIIPKTEEILEKNDIKYLFNSNSLTIDILDLSKNEASVKVDYIVNRIINEEEVTSQETLLLLLNKKNDSWKIESVISND